MKKISLYSFITIASTIIRQFYLPNPFEYLGEKGYVINLIAEPIIYVLAYSIVGSFYVKGSAPALGSLLYLFTYVLIVGLLWGLGLCSFAWWAILIALVVLGLLFYAIHWLKENFL